MIPRRKNHIYLFFQTGSCHCGVNSRRFVHFFKRRLQDLVTRNLYALRVFNGEKWLELALMTSSVRVRAGNLGLTWNL